MAASKITGLHWTSEITLLWISILSGIVLAVALGLPWHSTHGLASSVRNTTADDQHYTRLQDYEIGLWNIKVQPGDSDVLKLNLSLTLEENLAALDRCSAGPRSISCDTYSILSISHIVCVPESEQAWCDMWTQLAACSGLMLVCSLNAVLLFFAAAVYGRKLARPGRLMLYGLAPAVELLGLISYFSVTFSFPRGNGQQLEMLWKSSGFLRSHSFGSAFWISSIAGIVGLLPFLGTLLMQDPHSRCEGTDSRSVQVDNSKLLPRAGPAFPGQLLAAAFAPAQGSGRSRRQGGSVELEGFSHGHYAQKLREGTDSMGLNGFAAAAAPTSVRLKVPSAGGPATSMRTSGHWHGTAPHAGFGLTGQPLRPQSPGVPQGIADRSQGAPSWGSFRAPNCRTIPNSSQPGSFRAQGNAQSFQAAPSFNAVGGTTSETSACGPSWGASGAPMGAPMQARSRAGTGEILHRVPSWGPSGAPMGAPMQARARAGTGEVFQPAPSWGAFPLSQNFPMPDGSAMKLRAGTEDSGSFRGAFGPTPDGGFHNHGNSAQQGRDWSPGVASFPLSAPGQFQQPGRHPQWPHGLPDTSGAMWPAARGNQGHIVRESSARR